MNVRHSRKFTLIAVAAVACSGSPARAVWPVTDAVNAALNIEQLTQQAEQIAHQIEQIENQVRMIEQQAKMLQNLDFSNYRAAVSSMRQIENALRRYCPSAGDVPGRIGFQAGFDCRALLEQFRTTYPDTGDWGGQSTEQIAVYPDRWNAQKRDDAAKAMQVQNASVAAMAGTEQRMAELASASESAPGEKAAVQVTNEMLVTLSAQLREQQAATLALQRATASQNAEEAAEHERNKELRRRAARDADTEFDVPPVRTAFLSYR